MLAKDATIADLQRQLKVLEISKSSLSIVTEEETEKDVPAPLSEKKSLLGQISELIGIKKQDHSLHYELTTNRKLTEQQREQALLLLQGIGSIVSSAEEVSAGKVPTPRHGARSTRSKFKLALEDSIGARIERDWRDEIGPAYKEGLYQVLAAAGHELKELMQTCWATLRQRRPLKAIMGGKAEVNLPI